MILHCQNELQPSQILFSFDDVIKAELESVKWAVAYATWQGCAGLANYVSAKVGEEAWSRCKKEFVVSTDFGHTEPSALEYLASLDNSELRISNSSLIDTRSLFPNPAFHPKAYFFEYPEDIGMVTGSANLTKAAFHRNTELVSTETISKTEFSIDPVWKSLSRPSTPFSEELLATGADVRLIGSNAETDHLAVNGSWPATPHPDPGASVFFR